MNFLRSGLSSSATSSVAPSNTKSVVPSTSIGQREIVRHGQRSETLTDNMRKGISDGIADSQRRRGGTIVERPATASPRVPLQNQPLTDRRAEQVGLTDESSIVYLSLNLNQSTTSQGTTPIARTVARTVPILVNAEDYCVAVARFVCPQVDIPIWIPEMQLGQLSFPPVDLAYYVSLTYNGQTGTAQMQLDPFKPHLNVPPQVPLSEQPKDDYAFVDTPEEFVAILNSALSRAFAALSAIPAIGLPVGTSAPFITFSSVTGLMTMNAYPFSSYQDTLYPSSVGIYFSAGFAPFLAGWDTYTYKSTDGPDGPSKYLAIRIRMPGTLGTWSDFDITTNMWNPGPGSPPFIQTPNNVALTLISQPQFAQCWGSLSGLQSIQVTGTLPVENPQQVDSPFGRGAPSGNLTSVVLTDFAPDYNGPGATKQALVYTPSSIIPGARFIPLSGGALQHFDLSVSWVDSLGIIRPMVVQGQNQACSIMFVFVKKTYLKHVTSEQMQAIISRA